ncbi:MAG: hypothetical protein IJ766_01270 [Clostridia bacterium]|nr:hypothetical protein [Clostridia bacterium]
MTEAYTFAALLKDAVNRAVRAMTPCDVVTLRIVSAAPLRVRLDGVGILPQGTVYVCTYLRDRLTDGATAVAIRAFGGQKYYIFDIGGDGA